MLCAFSIYPSFYILLGLPREIQKSKTMKRIVKNALVLLCLLHNTLHAQNRSNTGQPSAAVVSLDVSGLPYDNIAMGSLVRLELEKLQKFEVLDKYDVEYIMKKNKINPAEAFGKRQLVDVGKLLGADKMLTGAAELFGEKIIFTLRLIDVKGDKIEKISVLEYINDQEYLQRMVRISLQDLLNMEVDKEELDRLVNLERPVITGQSTYSLNGPRFGMQFFSGRLADRMTAPKEEGGFNANPFGTVFGYQLEKQYLTAGEFQAVIEFIGSINGIESGLFTPSLAVMQGLRFHGWEFGFGPVVRLNRTAQGYYSDGKWIRADEVPEGSDIRLIREMDSRGDIGVATSLIVAVGKTFTSGYLHFPVNLYWSPMPEFDSHIVGFLLGFTIADKESNR